MLLSMFLELSSGSQIVKNVSGSDDVRCAQLMANMVLYIQTPEIMRIAVKCAKVYLQKADLRKVKILRSSKDADKPQGFLSEALRKIGAFISNSEQAQVPEVSPKSQESDD